MKADLLGELLAHGSEPSGRSQLEARFRRSVVLLVVMPRGIPELTEPEVLVASAAYEARLLAEARAVVVPMATSVATLPDRIEAVMASVEAAVDAAFSVQRHMARWQTPDPHGHPARSLVGVALAAGEVLAEDADSGPRLLGPEAARARWLALKAASEGAVLCTDGFFAALTVPPGIGASRARPGGAFTFPHRELVDHRS